MPWKKIQEPTLIHSPVFWGGLGIFLVVLMAGALLAPAAVRRYKDGSAVSSTNKAAGLYAIKDYPGAIASARHALSLDSRAVEAMRIMAKSKEALGDPDAIEWRRRLDAVQPGDPENTLALASSAVKEGDTARAEELLRRLQPQDQASALYHDVAAWIALSKRNAADAEEHWKEAARLDPEGGNFRLQLATLRLSSPAAGARAGALSTLNQLAKKPDNRIAALRPLLDDAVKNGNAAQALEIANNLGTDPQATFADQLKRLATLRTLKDTGAAALLDRLKKTAASKPDDLYGLVEWMNQNEAPAAVIKWVESLPAPSIAKPPVCVAVAEAYARDSQFVRLQAMLEPASWGELEYLRHAYLARAHSRLKDEARSTKDWKGALAGAESHPQSLSRLAKTVLGWGWKDKAEQALWKLAARDDCPRWALNELWNMAVKRGDSPKLFLVSKVMLRSEPASVMHRNNATFLGLLMKDREGAMHDQMAEQLHKEVPNNSIVASTYALSLYQRGRLEEALSVMNLIPQEELRRPVVALYYGIFLTAAGQRDKAAQYLEIGASGPLLPEEQALLAQSKVAASAESDDYIRKLNEAAAASPEELARLATWMNGRDLGPLVSKWASGLAFDVASKPPVAMALAEAHASAMDWKRLKATVEATSWADFDYLRNGYLALTAERLGDADGAAQAWQASVFAAEKSVESLEKLGKAVQGWGWDDKAEEVLWKLSGEPRHPEWVIDSLWNLALKRGDAARLYRAGKLLAGTNSLKLRARNNALVLALLTSSNELGIQEFIETLFKEAPGDAVLASIHALSLHQQGRMLEAMAVMAGCDGEALKAPAAAFYYAIFLTASKRESQAREYLDHIPNESLSPEDLALLGRARQPR
jgi:predicted Zn-dependent protease